eukprot:2674910-Amphidinium_carterae.1
MFEVPGVRSVMVGNSQPSLVDAVLKGHPSLQAAAAQQDHGNVVLGSRGVLYAFGPTLQCYLRTSVTCDALKRWQLKGYKFRLCDIVRSQVKVCWLSCEADLCIFSLALQGCGFHNTPATRSGPHRTQKGPKQRCDLGELSWGSARIWFTSSEWSNMWHEAIVDTAKYMVSRGLGPRTASAHDAASYHTYVAVHGDRTLQLRTIVAQ